MSVELQAQLRAVSALRGLSVDEDLRTEIVARGGLVPLLRLCNSDDVEIQMEVREYINERVTAPCLATSSRVNPLTSKLKPSMDDLTVLGMQEKRGDCLP